MAAPVDDTIANLIFLQEIEKYPCIYDMFKAYSMADKDEAWAEVSQVMLSSVRSCKKKWSILRSNYMKYKRGFRGDGKPYYLCEYMKFLEPFIKFTIERNPRKNTKTSRNKTKKDDSNENKDVKDSSECSNDWDYLDSPKPPEPKKTKLFSKQLCEQSKKNDTIKTVMRELAFDLRMMDHEQFNLFKRKVLTIVDEVMMDD